MIVKKYLKYLFDSMSNDCESKLLTYFTPNSKLRYLDCGCFNGKRTLEIASKIDTKHIYGIDFNKIKILKAEKQKINISYGDLNNVLPYDDNSFDIVTSCHSIEHLVYPDRFVKEVFRVLKPGGSFVILTPNLASWHNVFALVLGIQPFSGPNIFEEGEASIESNVVDEINLDEWKRRLNDEQDQEDGRHIKVMTYKTLVKLLKINNFKPLRSDGFGYYPFPDFIAKFLSKIDISHSHYMIISSQKPVK